MAPHMRGTTAVLGALFLALLLVPPGLTRWLGARWFAAQDLWPIFALRLQTQLGLGLAAAATAVGFSAINLAWAAWRLRRVASKEDRDSRGMATVLAAVPIVSLLVGLIFGLAAFGQWQTWLGFEAQVPFAQTDPTFGQDISFYVWTLPALTAARGWLTGLILVTALGIAIVYGLGLASIEPPVAAGRPYPFIARDRDLRSHPLLAPGVRHLAVLGAIFLLLVAASYWLNNWELVYSARGVVFGASATDLDRIDVRHLTGDGTLDAGVLARNQAALADVRITDWRPLLAAYNQLQRIRQYYEFTDIDVDRYDLKAGRQQVMLATREMDPA